MGCPPARHASAIREEGDPASAYSAHAKAASSHAYGHQGLAGDHQRFKNQRATNDELRGRNKPRPSPLGSGRRSNSTSGLWAVDLQPPEDCRVVQGTTRLGSAVRGDEIQKVSALNHLIVSSAIISHQKPRCANPDFFGPISGSCSPSAPEENMAPVSGPIINNSAAASDEMFEVRVMQPPTNCSVMYPRLWAISRK
jgi:hypothetical protein